jgi:hypothetical protein
MLQIIINLPLIHAFVAPRGVIPGLSGWRRDGFNGYPRAV